MSRKYLVYLAIALAVALAGCSFWPAAPAEKQAENSIEPLISLPTSAPSAPLAAQALAVSPFDLDGASWVEYKQTTNGGPASDVRLEYSSSPFGGGKMVSIKRTQTSNDASSLSTADGGKSYSARYSSSQSSTSSSKMSADQMKADDPILYSDSLTVISPDSMESVTVPGGTYDCKKYMASFKGSDAQYWGAAGVPVPVKIYTAFDGTTLELVGWG